MVARFAEAGAERIMLQDFVPRDLDMIDLMAEELVRAGLALLRRGGGLCVERVVAANRVRVRAAGAGDPLGQQLERRSRAE